MMHPAVEQSPSWRAQKSFRAPFGERNGAPPWGPKARWGRKAGPLYRRSAEERDPGPEAPEMPTSGCIIWDYTIPPPEAARKLEGRSKPCGVTSEEAYGELCRLVPGGVSSPFRAFHQVGGSPPVLVRAKGSRVWDLEGREYLDLVGAWGPALAGHAHPEIVAAAREAVEQGAVLGAPTAWELELARRVRRAFPSMERVRFVNSGAEAVAAALRVARAATGRPAICKFEGCYHGHVECLDSAGREAEEAGGPLALGTAPGAVADTRVAVFNDLESVERVLTDDVAAVIVEPVTGSMGVIPPAPGFLEGLRDLTRRRGALLLFDEVLTGFRVAPGGAQERYGVYPDLTCLGKALGGGFPIGAYGGRADLMDLVAPQGKVYQAGTFSGNPVSMRAGAVALEVYSRPGFHEDLERRTRRLAEGLRALGLCAPALGGMFSVGFGPRRLRDHRDAAQLDTEAFARFFWAMLEQGIYLPPSTFDAACLSAAHSDDDVERVLEAARRATEESARGPENSRLGTRIEP